MNIFYQLIYELQKGMRDLCLHTTQKRYKIQIENLLSKQRIPYFITEIAGDKINIFFGRHECIQILKSFSSYELNKISKNEDFILGIMLGYGKLQQYKRYLMKDNIFTEKSA